MLNNDNFALDALITLMLTHSRGAKSITYSFVSKYIVDK